MNSLLFATLPTASAPDSAAILYPLAADSPSEPVELSTLGLAQVEGLLGGELELVQLDAHTCLLTNAQAREQGVSKNMVASQLWFARHSLSGHGADFILGPVIYCQTAQTAHLQHLDAVPKPSLTPQQRADEASARARKLYDAGAYEEPKHTAEDEAKLLCSLENPEGCEMCGS